MYANATAEPSLVDRMGYNVITMDTYFVYLLFSLLFAICWVIYITYYNSRIAGYFITKIINRFALHVGYFKIGSFTLNALSGKIMFRDIVYITHDYTVRIQDGYLIFRWWRSYVPKDVSEDLSHSDTRLSVVLNGFELHVYNRSDLYSHLEEVFGLDPNIFPHKDRSTDEDKAMNIENRGRSNSHSGTDGNSVRRQRPEAAMARTWRDLIPVIKMDVSSGRIVFGNRLVPTTLSITVEDAHFVYSTKPAVCTLDRFMHFSKCKAENARVMLAPSPKYTGMLDEPPRYMGEGFVLMSTNYVELYFYMDEAGPVPEEPVLIRLANGDSVESSPPQWGVDIKCGKGIDFSYGPWADRQREHLFKFFYPQDYERMEVTKAPRPGEKRQMQSFDVRLSMLSEATIDVLFSKNKETNAVHINVGAGSYLEITLPWITRSAGYVTEIKGQLLHLEATTSLQFRDFVSSETLEFNVKCHYPLIWNQHQLWELSLTGCKASVFFVFVHKYFFQDLINDWASKQRPDLMHFVPYTWRFGLTLKHCEIMTLVNQYNWIDCSSVGQRQRLENTQLALCAHMFHLSFDLPFDQFLPETVPLNFSIQGESIDLSLFIPEFHTSRNIVLALEKYSKVLSKDGSMTKRTEIIPKWRNICQNACGWVDFWWVPIGAISIQWVYHPAPPLGPAPQADISTPVKEELLLSPMRFPHHRKTPHRSPDGNQKFDPTTLKADRVNFELEIGPSVLLLYGTALRNFLNFKENIFGDDQTFTDMQQPCRTAVSDMRSNDSTKEDSSPALPLEMQEDFDQRYYRPLEVDVSIIMHDVQAHLLKNCTESETPCPVILLERFGFEMKKRYHQTELQLLLSPAVMRLSDNANRPTKDRQLNHGRVTLSSLQIRGHAMFSDHGRSLDEDTIEYAWLVEIALGKICAKISMAQLYQLVASLETFFFLVLDAENDLKNASYVPDDDAKATANVVAVTPQTSAFQALLQPKLSSSATHHQHKLSQMPSVVLKGSGGKTKADRDKDGVDGAAKQRGLSVVIDRERKVSSTAAGSGVAATAGEPSLRSANQQSHRWKYKVCRVSVDAVDFWLVEHGTALQLWISPVRLATCNLHGKQVGSGLSCVIYNMSLRQAVWQPHKYSHSKVAAAPDMADVWLEVGTVNFGPVVVESAMAGSSEQNMYTTQQKFLKEHDNKSKRLWFLWPDLYKSTGKCGCIGGCSFFGDNRNGARFFKPSRTDLQDGVNVAAFRVNESGKDPGYGQSILHEGMLLFRTTPYIVNKISLQESPSFFAKSHNQMCESPKVSTLERDKPSVHDSCSSPASLIDRKASRRFSYTSVRSSNLSRDVPYSRLMENNSSHMSSVLPAKLDSDSKLHTTDKGKCGLDVPDNGLTPKNSVSDSKLAVDYFNTASHRNSEQSVSTHNGTQSDSVNPSESQHSLGVDSIERLQKEVQRTVSMSSENQSEAFFSADEEMNNPSRTSSLRHGMLGSGTVLHRNDNAAAVTAQRKKFASEMSIVADRGHLGPPSGPRSVPETTGRLRLSSHRSDHEIHTPEHRSLNGNLEGVQHLATPHRHQSGASPLGGDSSSRDSSDSYSSVSYVSAMGSQEDLTLVDLHMQLNRQIVDSPMLMSSYVGHLTQLRCRNWANGRKTDGDTFSAPIFQCADDGKLVYTGGRFVPSLETVTEGISSLKLVSRTAVSPGHSATRTPTLGNVYTWDPMPEDVQMDADVGSIYEEELLGVSPTDGGSRTSIIVKLKGDVDVVISPLLLEALQRFIDALIPTVATLHPLTVINHLHSSCVGQVETANVLKKTTERNCAVPATAAVGCSTSTDSGMCSVYEEVIKTQVQAAVVLPKVNIMLLQGSIVEEIITFSALDNIKDLTCVSLFAVCFDNITARFHCDKQAKEVLQTFYRPAVVQVGNKKGFTKAKTFLLGHSSTTSADTVRGEPVLLESCERQQQQLVVTLSVGKAHGQLRRLRNDSSCINDAVITAIPQHRSKVLFTCSKVNRYPRLDYYMQPPKLDKGTSNEDNGGNGTTTTTTTTAATAAATSTATPDDKLGFIMFECGLEGVSLKIVKKSQFVQVDTDLDDKGNNNNVKVGNESDGQYNDSIKSKDELESTSADTPKISTATKADDDSRPASGTKEPAATAADAAKDALLCTAAGSGNISSCIIDVKMVWFNFAAPPRAPITRKIDYTRLDWNLLSTASPAINAWMNPSNRLAIRVVHMFRTMYRRSTAIVACLMAEALDMQSIHMPTKSRYGKLTPLAKTLQEDPSCQLCTVLQKYVLQSDLSAIEASLRETDLPQLSTLRQGVIVLSRQWKSVLYTPLLLEHNYKSKMKPLNVTFTVSEMDEEMCLTDAEDPDVTDENAMLLHAGHILKAHPHKAMGLAMKGSDPGPVITSPRVELLSTGVESVLTSPSPPSVPHRKRKRSLPPSQPPVSSRASVVFPLLPPFTQRKPHDDSICYGTLREDRTVATNLGSDPSICSSPELTSSPLPRGRTGSCEDLYSWMAKQQDALPPLKGCMESKIDTLQTDSSGEGGAPPPLSLYPVHDSLRLLDAHLIFQPLLSSLGVMPQQMVASFASAGNNITSLDSLGCNLSVVGSMEAFRIDIAVSEHGKTTKKGKSKSKTRLHLEIAAGDESPAFVCEKVSVEVELDRTADMTVDDMIRSHNVLYISRGQLKKHTNTTLNFNVGVRYISQQVNMPLLRLLHQISNMYQNVKDTQNELREQQPDRKPLPKRSRSNSDVQEPIVSDNNDKQLSLKISDPGSVASQQKPIVSPSPSLRSRPQSFAQKLRSTGKSVKGYMNLSEGGGTPLFASSPSGSALEHITVSSDKSVGKCWKTVYHLLDLYATKPETKTLTHRFSVGAAGDISEHYKGNRKYDLLTEVKSVEDMDKPSEPIAPTPVPPREVNVATSGERTRLVVFGVAKIHRTRLLATLSGLKLEAEITSLHSSFTCRKKTRPAALECSLTGQVGRTMIVLLEGVAPSQQTVVKVTVGKSQALYSSITRRTKDKNSGLLTVGAVNVDIPQHPVALHGMVTRGSKQLSSTLQELRVTRTSSRLSRGVQAEEEAYSPHHAARTAPPTRRAPPPPVPETGLLQPLVMQFSVILQSLSITAALLPSLQAQYKMDQVSSTGVTGSKAKFTVDLPHHSLSFTTKLTATEANLPSEASIALPAVHVTAEYVPEGTAGAGRVAEGLVFRQGGYLSAHADIGVFEHSLTTDLLNHLVFVQKVFMKEVNEVVQKVLVKGERPVPLWQEGSDDSNLTRVLFSLVIRIQRIQLTATTAGSSAVRLETGAVALELSNRVQNISGRSARLFGKAQVDLNLSLGQLLRNALFEEAEPEFQQFAFFNTRIELRNAFQDETAEGDDKEVVLITLKRPLIYIQPLAVDKAILVWLNYKNAYDYWNEKRANLNNEVLAATQQVFEKVPFAAQIGTPHLGTLFLQLTVDDMGICLPLNPLPRTFWGQRGGYEDSRGAVVITLESTSISACSSGSLVSKGKFNNLCLRFADDFETSLDDWKPDMCDSSIMNLCVVSEGTYEVCSRTIAAKQFNENAKWFLNVQWQMEGVDIHLDVNVGKQLSALGHTLTMLTGAEDAPPHIDYDSDDQEPNDTRASQESILPAFIFDPSLDNKKRSKLIEKEMNEQAKIINDLRSLGASHGTIEMEMRRLHELEQLVYKDFRRDMIQKLRRQSVKASSIKGKLGLGSKASTYRSRSFIVPSPTPEHQLESPEDHGTTSVNSASYESSPRAGPSRSASLRVRNMTGARVTFSDNQNMCRQTSLPSASSDLSLPEGPSSALEWVDHLNIDGERVELRKKRPASDESVDECTKLPDLFSHVSSLQQNVNASSQMITKPQEPNIDLELDVKVLINSGKCVLHTKDPAKEEDVKISRMRKDRSCSAGLLDFTPQAGSPDPTRRNKDQKPGSSSRLRNVPHLTLVDLTIFHIPGMDVKLHYQSKVVNEESGSAEQMTPDKDKEDAESRGNSFPDVFGALLKRDDEAERIEQAFKKPDDELSGISNPNYGSSPTGGFHIDVTPPHESHKVPSRKPGIKKASLFAWMTLQSIPEETIISPHILEFLEQTLEPIPSSKSNFGAQEAMASVLPNEQDLTNYGNYVYASFPVDVIVYFHMQPSTFRFSCLPVSRVECMLQLPSLDIVFSSKRAEDEAPCEFGDEKANTAGSAVGGLSVTGCLADFSVYIFHPYGGKKSALKEAQWSPLADSERKDSLSINVEFVKFHLSRSRKLNFQPEKGKSDQSRAVIRFSTITDIGSASFKYDMRRLTEILAFPKAWYRRSIVRRLFLGDLSISAVYADDEDTTLTSKHNHEVRCDATGKPRTSPLLNAKEKLRLSLDADLSKHARLKDVGRAVSGESGDSPGRGDHKSATAWETLVLFAVNFTKLNVHMNMGNVMGNVSWLTKDFRSEGRLSIGSTGHKNMYIALGLGGSSLDAKAGIVGGVIDIADISTYVHIREEPSMEPDHTAGLCLRALELRLDYMATPVLMCRVSSLDVRLRDEWRLSLSMATRRPASIFMHGDLSWDQLQLIISKSTTADLLKMFYKLEEFFSQQFNSSKRAFSSRYSQPQRVQSNRAVPRKDAAPDATRHHRHWQKVLTHVGGLTLSTMHVPLPASGTVLGGTMELHGNNISLACFHGINFKTKSWALFSLREPSITFNTEAQEIASASSETTPSQDVHVVQTLTCSLGLSTYKTHHSMATVCKVSRNVIFPPQFKTLHEWFHYAFASSQIDEVEKFPSLERERLDAANRGGSSSSVVPKLQDPNHTREVIFALPSLQLHLKTEHLQSTGIPDPNGEKPTVECSFITEFEDHIFVTVDAEAFFFLHDLITSYVNEKEKVMAASNARANSPDPERLKRMTSVMEEDGPKKRAFDPADMFTKDWRNYNCKTWHLEPTVRLLSWAGKSIEPYGIDYILQKLGFSHARTTIPKWMQRGFMDPLDKVLAVLTLRMVAVIKDDKQNTSKS